MTTLLDPPIVHEEPSIVRALNRLGERRPLLAGIALALIAAIAVADYATGDQIHLFILYMLPVSLLAWGAGLYVGLASAVLSSAVTLGVYWLLAGGRFETIHGWHVTVTLVSAATIAWAIARLKADHLRISSLLESERLLSRTDAMTGLASAHAFHERLTLEIDRMRRVPKPLSLLYVDLDDFKKVNDERGHLAGDQLLARVGKLLLGATRRVDLCGRVGGDEFAVLMPETSAADAMTVAERVRESIRKSFQEGGAGIGTSSGLSTLLTAPIDAQAAISSADQLMYEAKNGGKQKIVARTLV